MLQMKEAQNNTNQRTNISTLTNQTGAFKDNGALKTKMDSIWYVQLKAWKAKSKLTLMVWASAIFSSSNNSARELKTLLSFIWFSLWKESSAFEGSGNNAAIFINEVLILFCISSELVSCTHISESSFLFYLPFFSK